MSRTPADDQLAVRLLISSSSTVVPDMSTVMTSSRRLASASNRQAVDPEFLRQLYRTVLRAVLGANHIHAALQVEVMHRAGESDDGIRRSGRRAAG